MDKSKQSIFGKDNLQIMIGNVYYDAKNVCKGIGELFNKYDARMNELCPKGIKYSKIEAEKKKFESSKIFSSLVKIDIPFESALQIVYIVVVNLINELEKGKYVNELSTHIIRKEVQNAILNYSDNDVSEEEKEKWADKYVRRYGHDGRQVQVYFNDSSKLEPLNFNFAKILLEDIFSELGIREKAYKQEISSTQISVMGKEIIEFVNNCNIYKVNYETLKNFIIEMALQPPHPWFVTEETALSISKYDLEALENHYKELYEACENKCYENLFYRVYEALHHASSSILARYCEVLGAKDLDVFYHLESIVTKLCKREEKDLLIESQKISSLPSDLKYISITMYEFLVLLRRIKNKLVIGKIISILDGELVSDVVELCEIAIALDKTISKQDLYNLVNSEWTDFSSEHKRKLVRQMFYIIEGLEVETFSTKCKDCFWIARRDIRNKKLFTICMDKNTDLQSIKEYYSNRKIVLRTEAIFVVMENKNEYENYKEFIEDLENENYYIEIVTKDDLKNIFMSINKYKAFNDIINRDE